MLLQVPNRTLLKKHHFKYSKNGLPPTKKNSGRVRKRGKYEGLFSWFRVKLVIATWSMISLAMIGRHIFYLPIKSEEILPLFVFLPALVITIEMLVIFFRYLLEGDYDGEHVEVIKVVDDDGLWGWQRVSSGMGPGMSGATGNSMEDVCSHEIAVSLDQD